MALCMEKSVDDLRHLVSSEACVSDGHTTVKETGTQRNRGINRKRGEKKERERPPPRLASGLPLEKQQLHVNRR